MNPVVWLKLPHMAEPLETVITPEETVRALREEIARRKHSEERLQLLADATNILIDDVLDYETRLRNLAKIIVPYFADWCAIDIVIPGKESYTVITHSSPEKIAIAEEIKRKYPPKSDAGYGVSEVIRTRTATIYPQMPDELVRRTTQTEEHYRLMKSLGIQSVMVVPMVTHDQALGGITFVMADSGYHYNDADLEVAKQLAHRAGVALDNALVHEELLEANRAKEKFLAMLAHELRNPLTPIRNSLPLLMARSDEDYEIKDIAEIMDRQVKTMSRLLDDLFDVARITEGKIQFHMEDLDLLSVLDHAILTLRPEYERKGYKFSAYITEGPLYIHGDRVRIEQVLVNLLNNAVKYTPHGGHIALECIREDDEAVIRIRDSGKGIPPNMLKRIFQLFIQVDQSLDRPEGGLGLGLTIVQMLVEKHGGSVTAHSEGIGKGSEFVVRLPLIEKMDAKKSDDRPRPIAADPKKRILVVDDNEDAANSIGKLLRKIGHDVRITYDGMSALEIAKEFRPETVLLDLGLPILDGYETARQLRVMYSKGRLLLVALSGYGQEEDRKKTEEAGFDYHLVKPFDTHALREILNSWTPQA
jgi:signal transduction histidine kinase/ActR/RegA family two-component response regulator